MTKKQKTLEPRAKKYFEEALKAQNDPIKYKESYQIDKRAAQERRDEEARPKEEHA